MFKREYNGETAKTSLHTHTVVARLPGVSEASLYMLWDITKILASNETAHRGTAVQWHIWRNNSTCGLDYTATASYRTL